MDINTIKLTLRLFKLRIFILTSKKIINKFYSSTRRLVCQCDFKYFAHIYAEIIFQKLLTILIWFAIINSVIFIDRF